MPAPAPAATPSTGSTAGRLTSALGGIVAIIGTFFFARQDMAAPPAGAGLAPPPAAQTPAAPAPADGSDSTKTPAAGNAPGAGAGADPSGTDPSGAAAGAAAAIQPTFLDPNDYVAPIHSQVYWLQADKEGQEFKASTHLKVNQARVPMVTQADLQAATATVFSAVDAGEMELLGGGKVEAKLENDPSDSGLVRLDLSTTNKALASTPAVKVWVALKPKAAAAAAAADDAAPAPFVQLLALSLNPTPAPVPPKASLAIVPEALGTPAIRLERTRWCPPCANPAKLAPLIIAETGQAQAVDVQVESVSILPAGGDWTGTPSLRLIETPFSVPKGGVKRLTPALSGGDFPVGTTTGVLRLNSTSLDKALEVRYEVVTRLHKWVMFATALLGCLVGYLVKKVLTSRRDLAAQRIVALDALRQIEERGESYSKDAAYLARHQQIKTAIVNALALKKATAESVKNAADAALQKQEQSETALTTDIDLQRDRLKPWGDLQGTELASPPAKALLDTIKERCAAAQQHLQDSRDAAAAGTKLDELDTLPTPEMLAAVHRWSNDLADWLTRWLADAASLPLKASSFSLSRLAKAQAAAAVPPADAGSASEAARQALTQVAALEEQLTVLAFLLPKDLAAFMQRLAPRLAQAATTDPKWDEAATALTQASRDLAAALPGLITAAVQDPGQGITALRDARNDLEKKWTEALAFVPAAQLPQVLAEIKAAHWEPALEAALASLAAPPPPLPPVEEDGAEGDDASGADEGHGGLESMRLSRGSSSDALRISMAGPLKVARLEALGKAARAELDKLNLLLSAVTFALYCVLLLLVFPDWMGDLTSIGTVFFSGFLIDLSVSALVQLVPTKLPNVLFSTAPQ